MLLAPKARKRSLDGGWGDLDVPGLDLDDLDAFDFEWLRTELSTDVANELASLRP